MFSPARTGLALGEVLRQRLIVAIVAWQIQFTHDLITLHCRASSPVRPGLAPDAPSA